MTGPEALKQLKIRSWEINSSIPQEVLYEALTFGHKRVIKDLSTKNTEVANLYSRFEADLSAWRERYDNFPLQRVSLIEIKYEPDGEYIPVKDDNITISRVSGALPKNREAHQEGNKTKVEVIGNSIVIYPTPKYDVPRGIRVTGKCQYVERINQNTSSLLFGKLQNYEDLVISAAKMYLREYLKDTQGLITDRNLYRAELQDSLASLSIVEENAQHRRLERYRINY